MLLALHKPFNVLSQFTPDVEGQRTLAEFGFPKNVYPLGRLDYDSEGLLLLSDEAGLNNRSSTRVGAIGGPTGLRWKVRSPWKPPANSSRAW